MNYRLTLSCLLLRSSKYFGTMKAIGNFLIETYKDRAQQLNEAPRAIVLDDQSIFYVFKKIVAQEYGARGEQNIEARYYKDKKLFVASKSSLWMSELQLNRQYFIEKMNEELGTDAILEIKVESSFS